MLLCTSDAPVQAAPTFNGFENISLVQPGSSDINCGASVTAIALEASQSEQKMYMAIRGSVAANPTDCGSASSYASIRSVS